MHASSPKSSRNRRVRELFGELACMHYDPLYAKSQAAHFHQWEARRVLRADALDDTGIEQLAQALATGALRAG